MKDQYFQFIIDISAVLSGLALLFGFFRYIRRKLTRKGNKKRKNPTWIVLFIFIILLLGSSFIYNNSLPISHFVIRPLFELHILKPFPNMVTINKGISEVGENEKGIGNIFIDNPNETDNYHNEYELKELQREHGFPKKNIHIKNDYKISRNEISFLEYDYYVWSQQKNGYKISYPYLSSIIRYNRPVVNVTFFDIKGYIDWLSKTTKKSYRLPSEAEWEYAARGGTSTLYPWGDEYSYKLAQCNNFESSTNVGSFLPNNFGLFNTSGNVWEVTCSKWKKIMTPLIC